MTYELKILLWAVVLGIIHQAVEPMAATGQKGYMKWNAGPRDSDFDVGVLSLRLKRAFANFRESFAFFAVVVLALAIMQKSNELSQWGARLYLIGRIAYLPLYGFGVPHFRSLAFGVSMAGIIMCLMTAFS